MRDPFLVEMGARLAERRRQLNISQSELAGKVGLTIQSISYAENGVQSLRPQNVVKLCDALGMSADYLLRGRDSSADLPVLFQRMADLPPKQLCRLEAIIRLFMDAVQSEEE